MQENRETASVPPLFRRHARRPRLTSLLDAATAQSIILTAPAGYGKTTLAQEWLQGHTHVAWYRATSASADLAAFSTGVAALVERLVPGAGERLRQRVRIGDTPERAARPLAELLAEDLAKWPEGAWLVVDDYHLVMDSAPVEEFIDWLLTLAPLRLLVTSRRRPGWASARRVLYGEIVEIGREQLAMNDEEASRVLSDRSGEAVRALVQQAEGWPALIGLAALSASLELPEERVSDALFRYFAEEVLRNEPPEVQRFMLLASIPASISPQVAREALDFVNPEPIIERLKNEDLLHEDAGMELKLHPLLRDFLRRRVQSEWPAESMVHAKRVLAFAQTHLRWQEAFELAVDTDDLETASAILCEAAPTLLGEGRIETLEKWLGVCGRQAVESSVIQLVRAELLLHRGQISDAVWLARSAADKTPNDDPSAPRAWNLAGRALHFISDDTNSFRCHAHARELATDRKDVTEALWGLFLSSNEVHPDRAPSFLTELESISSGDIDTQLRLAVGHYFVAEQRGTLAGLWTRYGALLPAVANASDPMAKTSYLANSAAINISRGHYELAHELAEQALRLARDLHLDFAVGACLLWRASAEIGRRKFARARETLVEFGRTSTKREDPYFQLSELTVRLKLAVATGAVSHVEAVQSSIPANTVSRRGLGELLATLTIALASQGRTSQARSQGTRARELVGSVEAIHCSRIGLALADVVEQATDKAIAALRQAVIRSAEHEFLDGIVVATRAYPRLIDLIGDDARTRPIIRQALSLSNDSAILRRALIKKEPAHGGLLTPRELDVLALLDQGYSNSEIARRLFISESTVKVHVHHILRKLGVRTRLQAVLQARDYVAE